MMNKRMFHFIKNSLTTFFHQCSLFLHFVINYDNSTGNRPPGRSN